MSITVQFFLILIVVLLAETVGLWFINSQLNIPDGRMQAANWVYQFTIITFIINILIVPYNACLIAFEKMSFYAYVSIAESVLRLAMAFLLQFIFLDKLIAYAGLISIICFIILLLYVLYCRHSFLICRYTFFWESPLFKKLLSFSGWSLLGSFSDVAVVQGINLLLNMFLGVVVNAAMGIAYQVNAALNSFVLNFQTAFKPQLIKIYANGDKQYLHNLIIQTSKMSFSLLLILVLPVLLNTSLILHWWLKTVPDYTVSFCQLVIISSLIDAIAGPLWITVQATGNIKKYQIVISSVLLTNLIVSYFLLKTGFDSTFVLWTRILICAIALIIRLFFVRKLTGLSIRMFTKKVFIKIIIATAISLPLPFIAHYFLEGWISFIVTSLLSCVCVGLSVYYIVLQADEKAFMDRTLLKLIKKS